MYFKCFNQNNQYTYSIKNCTALLLYMMYTAIDWFNNKHMLPDKDIVSAGGESVEKCPRSSLLHYLVHLTKLGPDKIVY